MKKIIFSIYLMTLTGLGLLGMLGTASGGQPLSGAVFTTNSDGTVVNGNRYNAMEDVYLNGGPGPNAPDFAAGLPAGDYYFQVTDPSGADLLSSDHITCRRVHVDSSGVFVNVVSASMGGQSCEHATDINVTSENAITVQLSPFDATPNAGGVYKVWVTPVGMYAGDINSIDPINGEHVEPGNFHGFIPAYSKTDNFMIPGPDDSFVAPKITVLNFHDVNFNGVWDDGEEEIAGWEIDVTDPAFGQNIVFTSANVTAQPAGLFTFVDGERPGFTQTMSMLNGFLMSVMPNANPTVMVDVEGYSGEQHEVTFGTLALGSITACKMYDSNTNGAVDLHEVGIPGWKIELSGNFEGSPMTVMTGENGCVTFEDLYPGQYSVREVMPEIGTWFATTPVVAPAMDVNSSLVNGQLQGTMEYHPFTNRCTATADFGTKGFWHNKNGLALITPDDVAYANGLMPYKYASSYFEEGDEPFNGAFANGDPVASAGGKKGPAAGSVEAEIYWFLVNSNANGDHREQLAQQLLAFIFNARHALGGVEAYVQDPADPGNFVSAESLIQRAVDAWMGYDAQEQTEMKSILDAFNNNDAVLYIPITPCAVDYSEPGY